MICKIGNIIVCRDFFNLSDVCALVLAQNLCIFSGYVFKFLIYDDVMNHQIQFTLLTDQNFIWDRTLIKVL
jgi:hypothetical protein